MPRRAGREARVEPDRVDVHLDPSLSSAAGHFRVANSDRRVICLDIIGADAKLSRGSRPMIKLKSRQRSGRRVTR